MSTSGTTRMFVFGAISVATFLIAAGNAAAGPIYSAVNDFSLASNPNGVWSYLSGAALLGSASVGSCSGGNVDVYTNGMAVPDSVSIIRNVSAGTVTCSGSVTIPTDHLNLDPEASGPADVEFTAPAAGSYSIVGDFLGDDTSEQSHSVSILLDGTPIFTGTISSHNQSDPFNLTESLNSGDTVVFKVPTGSSFSNLGTGLAATLTAASAVPEPSSAALLFVAALAVAGLVCRARHAE